MVVADSPESIHGKTPKSKFKAMPDHTIEKTRLSDAYSNSETRFIEDLERERILYASTRNLFDMDELLLSAEQPRQLVLPDFGFYFTYCQLNSKERAAIRDIKHVDTVTQTDMQNRAYLAKMIAKANPQIKDIAAKIDRLPHVWVDAALLKLGKENNRFLLPLLKDALAGLNQMQSLKKSFS